MMSEAKTETGVAAILVACFAFGFFAAGFVPVFWLVALLGACAVASFTVTALQGMAILHAIALAAALFILGQIGYGIGLFRVAALRKRVVPD